MNLAPVLNLFVICVWSTGGEALVSCGMMESMLKVIKWPGEDEQIHTTVSWMSLGPLSYRCFTKGYPSSNKTLLLTIYHMSVSQWEHVLRQHIVASTFERYSFGLLMAILQAATRPIPTPSKMTIHLTQPRVIWTATPGESHQRVISQRASTQQDHSQGNLAT